MIVCSCHGITDGDLRRDCGPGGKGAAHNAAGTGCGNCLPLVTDIVRQAQRGQPRSDDCPETTRDPQAPGADLTSRG